MLFIDPMICLAAAIYFESRGELIRHQMMVAQTVMNRVVSKRYPDSICEVVMQKHQFTFYWDGKLEKIEDEKAWYKAKLIASVSLSDEIEVTDVCHYARKDIDNRWTKKMQENKETHGNHTFYKGGC